MPLPSAGAHRREAVRRHVREMRAVRRRDLPSPACPVLVGRASAARCRATRRRVERRRVGPRASLREHTFDAVTEFLAMDWLLLDAALRSPQARTPCRPDPSRFNLAAALGLLTTRLSTEPANHGAQRWSSHCRQISRSLRTCIHPHCSCRAATAAAVRG
jgi:hypothetical protein